MAHIPARSMLRKAEFPTLKDAEVQVLSDLQNTVYRALNKTIDISNIAWPVWEGQFTGNGGTQTVSVPLTTLNVATCTGVLPLRIWVTATDAPFLGGFGWQLTGSELLMSFGSTASGTIYSVRAMVI